MGLFSSVKKAVSKVGSAVKSAVSTVGSKIADASPVISKVAGVVAAVAPAVPVVGVAVAGVAGAVSAGSGILANVTAKPSNETDLEVISNGLSYETDLVSLTSADYVGDYVAYNNSVSAGVSASVAPVSAVGAGGAGIVVAGVLSALAFL